MNAPRRGVLLCIAEQEVYRKLKHEILARPRPIEIHRVSRLSQLRAKLPRLSPAAIVLDESSAPLTTSPGELRKVSRQAPLIFIGSAAAGPCSLRWWPMATRISSTANVVSRCLPPP